MCPVNERGSQVLVMLVLSLGVCIAHIPDSQETEQFGVAMSSSASQTASPPRSHCPHYPLSPCCLAPWNIVMGVLLRESFALSSLPPVSSLNDETESISPSEKRRCGQRNHSFSFYALVNERVGERVSVPFLVVGRVGWSKRKWRV